MDNEIDWKIDVTAIPFLLVQNRQQTHGWTLIGSGANGLGTLECEINGYNEKHFYKDMYLKEISVNDKEI